MYYEIYVGSRSIRVFTGLVETYKFLKELHQQVLFHSIKPLMHLRTLKHENDETPLLVSYILFEIDDTLYIRSVKVVKKCVSQ